MSIDHQYEVHFYSPEEAEQIYQELEVPNWAPWLRASVKTLARRAEVFSQGQLAIWTSDNRPIANLSLNRFNYNDDPKSLPTWDQLTGTPPTYETTYDPNGNAVGMMSINVHPEYQGSGLTRIIVDTVKELRPRLGINHIMGSFRPSQFGEYSYENPYANFTLYTNLTRPSDNLPVDGWLRALVRNGMRMLRIDDAAMVIPDIPREQFDEYRAVWKPEKWSQISQTVWRCGETGLWFVGEKVAVYAESNVWGILDQQ